jgi:hypothetical protein
MKNSVFSLCVQLLFPPSICMSSMHYLGARVLLRCRFSSVSESVISCSFVFMRESSQLSPSGPCFMLPLCERLSAPSTSPSGWTFILRLDLIGFSHPLAGPWVALQSLIVSGFFSCASAWIRPATSSVFFSVGALCSVVLCEQGALPIS